MTSVILPPSPNWYASHLADVAGGLHAFCAHNAIVVADAHNAQVHDVLRGHANRTTAVAFVADESILWILSAASDKSLRLWIRTDEQKNTFSCRRALGKRPAEVRAIAAATGAAVAVLGDASGNLFLWDVANSPERARRLESCKRPAAVTSLACSPRPGETLVVAGCANGEVAIVDWEKEAVLCVLHQHTAEVQCLRWGCLAVENAASETSGSFIERKYAYLLLSAAPGERLRVYEIIESLGATAVCAGEVVATLGDNRDVSLVSTLAPPSSPANLAQGQRQRLWLSADWVPTPVVRRASGATDAWLVMTGYGGGLLARRVPLVLAFSGEGSAPAEPTERPIIRLPGGHSRTVFSVRCILDLNHLEPGVRLLTIGMDRAAAAWWAPTPRLDPSAFLEAAGDEEALEELEKKAWQRNEREALLVGLGAFPHALAAKPTCFQQPTPGSGVDPEQPRLLVGCGDASIKLLPLKLNINGLAGSSDENDESVGVHTLGDDGVTLWQGIPAAVTSLIWHPTISDVAAFGCADGSLGLAHCSRGTVILAPAKHKAAISSLAWFPVELEYYLTSGNLPDDYDEFSFGLKGTTPEYCHLLSMSSDGSLFRWPVWPNEDLLDLFPTEPPKKHVSRADAAVCKELGRPEAVQALPGMFPTAMAPLCTSFDEPGAVVGLNNGSAQIMGAGGDLFPLSLTCSVGSGAVTHMAAGQNAVYALHADGTLSLELPGADLLPATVTLPNGAAAAAAVTCLSVANDDGHVAVASQDGVINIWRIGMDENSSDLMRGRLDCVATLRGHSGPVLALTWLTVVPLVELESMVSEGHKSSMILVSGAEDQTVKAWDVKAAIAAAEARQAAAAAVETQAAEAVATETVKDSVAPEAGGDAPEASAPAEFSVPAVATKADNGVPPPPPPPLHAQETDPPSEAPPAEAPVPAPAPSAAPKPKKPSAAAAPPSLGSKGVLPPHPPKADTAEAQEALLGPLLALAAEVAPPGTAPAEEDAEEGLEGTFFESLGCVVDPVDGAASLRAASAALLAGPAQPPAAAKQRAQRAAAMALWTGDFGIALDILLKNDALTADFVSVAAAAGRDAWAAAARAYAGVLEDRGEPHLAAVHLLSVGDAVEAVQMYLRAGMARDAATLAATRLPPAHPVVSEARVAYAMQLEGREEWERAAAQHLAAGQWEKAMNALYLRGTPAADSAVSRVLDLWGITKRINYDVLRTLIEDSAREAEAQGLVVGGVTLTPPAPAQTQKRRRYSSTELETARLRVLSGSGGTAGTLADRLPPELRK